jgi:hypothetical protein
MSIPSAKISTVDFLPQKFKKTVNKKILSPTHDQKVQKTQIKKTK